MGTLLLPLGQVESMLPAGTVLAAPSDPYPVLIFFNHQSSLTTRYDGRPEVRTGDYREIGIFVAGVAIAGRPERYGFMPRLYLDNLLPTLSGRWLFGFDKRLAGFETWPQGFRVTRFESGDLLAEASYTENPIEDRAAFERNFAPIREGLALPVLTVRNGKFLCTDFDWNFPNARIQPVRLQADLGTDFYTAKLMGRHEIAPVDLAAAGAFVLESDWTLPEPHPCEN
jgi:hypothetical protein